MVVNISINGSIEHLHIHIPNIQDEVSDVSAKFDAIMNAMTEEGTVIDSLLVLVDELASNSLSADETNQILQEMSAKRDKVAAALLANTKAATVEPSTATPDAASTPGMTTGNNEGGGSTTSGDTSVVTEPPVDTNVPPTSGVGNNPNP